MMLFPGSRSSAILLILMVGIFSSIYYSKFQFKKNEILRYKKKYELELKLMEKENLEEIGMEK